MKSTETGEKTHKEANKEQDTHTHTWSILKTLRRPVCGRRGPLHTLMLSPHLRDTQRIKLRSYLGESTSPRQVHVCEYMPVHGDAGAIHLLLNKLQSQLTVLSGVQRRKVDNSARTAAQVGVGAELCV